MVYKSENVQHREDGKQSAVLGGNMSFYRKLAALSVTVAAIGSALAVSAPVAAAAPAPGVLAEAPGCVYRYWDNDPSGFAVVIENNCSYTVRVQVIVDWGTDSPCWSLAPGADKYWFKETITGQYSYLATC
ncbi:hypothetical protein [Streptomyces sp. NPDC102437]|uniref:hypothetical protein n=1 Tax=Streptomyces sp. NPDC102437 TaxID=3366175 RepID=UPI0037F49FF4